MRRGVWACLIITALAVPANADRRAGKAVTVVHEPPDEVPTLGPRHAPVTVEFFCNFHGEINSIRFYKLLNQLAQRHPRRLRVEFHIIGNQYSEAAYEAFAQGKFHAFADAAFSQRHRPRLEHIMQWAKTADMNLEQLQQALDDGRHKPAIATATALRERRGSRKRRLAFNGEFPSHVPSNLDELEDHYDLHYKRAKVFLDNGVAVDELFARLVRDVEGRRAKPAGLVGKYDPAPGLDPPPVEAPKLASGDLHLDAHPSRGPEDARVVMALYCSMKSHNCLELYRRVQRSLRVYPDDVRVVFVPLFDDDVHPGARLAHETALCAGDQGQFWAFTDKLFGKFRPNQLDFDSLAKRAEEIDLDVESLRECVDRRTHADALDQAIRNARDAGILYTPSLVVGRRIYVGSRSHDELLAIIADAMRPGLLERARDLRRQILEALTPSGVDSSDPPPTAR